MAIISVIIPVYNCEATLEKAVSSACDQTFRDIEIVIVDDCSTDNSFAVAQRLAQNDARIKCTRLPENGGSSVARNTAIDLATGEWIAVLDADDWYEPNRLEVMLEAARKLGADMVCDELKIYDHARNEVVDETRHGKRGEVAPLTAETVFRHDNPLRRHAIGYVKPMIRRAFLNEHAIRNDPVHRAGQDFIFLAEIVLSGAKSYMIPGAYYVYVHRISPTTRKISPHSRSDAGFELIVRGCDELMEKYGKTMDPAAKRALEQRRWIFESRIQCDDMLAAARQKNFVKAFTILAKNLFILILIGMTVLKWIYANLLLYGRKVGLAH